MKKWAVGGASVTASLPGDLLVHTLLVSFEPFELSAEVVQMRWFRSKFIPELTLNTH